MDIEKIKSYDDSHPHKISYTLCEYMCKKLIDSDHRDFRKDAMVKILKESMDEIGFKNGIVHLSKEVKKEEQEVKKETKKKEKTKEENVIIVRDDEEEKRLKNMEIERQMKKGVNPIFLEQFKNLATTYNIQKNEYHVHFHGIVPQHIIEQKVGEKRQRIE
jgi:hypothetical protein